MGCGTSFLVEPSDHDSEEYYWYLENKQYYFTNKCDDIKRNRFYWKTPTTVDEYLERDKLTDQLAKYEEEIRTIKCKKIERATRDRERRDANARAIKAEYLAIKAKKKAIADAKTKEIADAKAHEEAYKVEKTRAKAIACAEAKAIAEAKIIADLEAKAKACADAQKLASML